MWFFSNVLALFAFLILVCIFYWYYKIPKNLPPGPLGLPLVGSLLFLKKKPYFTFIELAKKYGNVFHIFMGSTLVIVLNDFESIKEAFIKQGEIFSGRMEEPHYKGKKNSNLGIIHTDGEYWRIHRRFRMSNLRSNGVGKHALEPKIMNEIQYFVSEIQKLCGQSVSIKNLLIKSLFNNVLLLANNTKYDYESEELNNFVDSLNRYLKLAKSVVYGTFFPWIRNVPGLEVIAKERERIHEFNMVMNAVETLIKAKDNHEDGEDTYIKAFMEERKRRIKQSENETLFTEDGLLYIARDILAAGGETSATMLNWILLYLTKYPKVQLKAQEEIDKKIGCDREVTYDDRLITPYIEAIIMETQRIVSLTPLSQPHRTIRKTNLFGYDIPTSTMIFPNLYAVHHDPNLWGDPENYRPERFIGEDGQLLKPEYLLPFSLGKRACAGEALARMELYLYLVTFLQKFKLVPTKTHQNLKATAATARQPICDLICFEKRYGLTGI